MVQIAAIEALATRYRIVFPVIRARNDSQHQLNLFRQLRPAEGEV